MKVLMVGATGSNAGLVLPEMLKRGVEVRALVRDESRAERARQHGAQETVLGDLEDPASLRDAADGMDGVFHINPAFAPGEGQMGVAMVHAAADAGVRKFVFSSVYHPSINAMANHREKQPVEEVIFESDLDFTILQPSMFMQNLGGLVEQARRDGRIAMPYSVRARTCWVDYRDVAEVAAIAMTGEELSYGTFELCAPGMVDRVELATLLSELLGRKIEAAETSPEQGTRGLPDGPVRDGLRRMTDHYDKYGFVGGNGLVLRSILGREARSLRDFFIESAAE